MRLLSILEASTITGPARLLLDFAVQARPVLDLHVAVFRRPGASDLFIETARRLHIDVHLIPEAGRFDRTVFSGLTALARELKPDLIESQAVKSHFLVRLSGLDRRFPWVAFHHGYTWPTLRMRAYNCLDRWSLPRARKVLTVNVSFRNDLIRKGVPPGRIEVVHSAIEIPARDGARSPEEIAAARSALGLAPDQPIILIVGRLSREKNHRTLLAALRRLQGAARIAAAPPPRLLVVGDGPERSRIEQTIAASDLGDCVTMIGHVPSAGPYYRVADVAVLPSLTEGSPLALLEAMAARVPVVAAMVGGIPEMVSQNESALLVEPRDDKALAGAIAAILAGPDLAERLAATAYTLVCEKFSIPARAGRLLSAYSSALSRSPV